MKSEKAKSAKAAKPSATSRKPLAPPQQRVARSKVVSTATPPAKPSVPSALRARLPHVPPLLLEGDPAPPPVVKKPEPRHESPVIPARPATPASALPESYGTGQLRVTAPDPRSLHAQWDPSPKQQRALDAGQPLRLRISPEPSQGQPVQQVELPPGTRECFVPVAVTATPFVVELATRQDGRQWAPLARSQPVQTPPDAPAEDRQVQFLNIPVDAPLPAREELARLSRQKNKPHVNGKAVQHPSTWTPEQELALEELIQQDLVRHQQGNSVEIAELLRRQRRTEAPSVSAPGAPESQNAPLPSAGVSSPAAPFGEAGRQPNFRLSVNAELVITGATAPDAAVTIGGHHIQLRSDGTFSFRLALPDGIFQLPVVAFSADGQDQRGAELGFSRTTLYHGNVVEYPLSTPLAPPPAEDFP